MQHQSGKALLFMPDISGFTAFVHNTEVKHSQHIISELLELLIDSNELGLELVEIEGDALFYFKQGDLPDYGKLIAQVKKMFIQFHHHLKLYESKRICQCGACTSANNLKLKFVLHYGHIDFLKVKDKSKPLGSSVIAIHRLLKNSVPSDEYALFSQDLVSEIEIDSSGMIWENGKETYDELGDIDYKFIQIEKWNEEVPQVPTVTVDDLNNLKPVKCQIVVDREVLDVYEVITNMKYRKHWNKSLTDIEYDENQLNKDGYAHNCVIDGNNIHFISRNDRSKKDQWVYIEQTTDIPLTKKVSTYFILTPKNNSTTISAEVYIEPQNFFAAILLPIFRMKISKNIQEGLQHIKQYAEENSITQEDLAPLEINVDQPT